jgi:hypothetical protein
MASKYASGKYSIAECDRCGQRFMLKDLKNEVIKTKLFQIKVCKSCWDPDQPQLSLGLYPVNDPQAVRNPRPDVSYYSSGATGLYTSSIASNSINNAGYPSDGSRQFQWGWGPVGGASSFSTALTPNNLIAYSQVGTVTITS